MQCWIEVKVVIRKVKINIKSDHNYSCMHYFSVSSIFHYLEIYKMIINEFESRILLKQSFIWLWPFLKYIYPHPFEQFWFYMKYLLELTNYSNIKRFVPNREMPSKYALTQTNFISKSIWNIPRKQWITCI
jgi:hypothetical protein